MSNEVQAQETSLMTQLAEMPAPAFNPFAILATEEDHNELAAMAGRFNKSWKSQRSERIAAIVAEHKCSAVEACFAIWLQDDARAILSRERIKTVSDAIFDKMDEVTGKSAKVALDYIEAQYGSVDPAEQPEVGRRVRDLTHRQYTIKMATTLLETVYKHLNIKEREWMS